MTELCYIHAYGLECCASCGTLNRYWVSKKGYGEEYVTWLETGLCPKCANPKEPKTMTLDYVIAAMEILTGDAYRVVGRNIRWYHGIPTSTTTRGIYGSLVVHTSTKSIYLREGALLERVHTHTLEVECSWCGKHIRQEFTTEPVYGDFNISHGICSSCESNVWSSLL